MNNSNIINIDALLKLNEELIICEDINKQFELLVTILKKEFNISFFSISVNNIDLFNNIDKNRENLILFDIRLNNKESLSCRFLKNENTDIESLKSLISFISQAVYNKFLEKNIQMKDSLTGLYNKTYMFEYLKSAIPLTKREKQKIAFLKIGIDHFKAVIDEFDYQIGDKVIVQLAEVLKTSVRESDIIARFDSDEFLVMLHNITSENNAISVAKKLINNFKMAKIVVNDENHQSLMKTICTGILICPDDAKGINEILRSSDIALYEAKNLGRGQFYKYKKDEDLIELF